MKSSIKMLVRGFCRILVFPIYLFYILFSLFLTKEKNLQGFSQLFSLFPGIFGEYLRREFYRLTLKSCSKDCCISFGTIFSTDDVEIGSGVYIGAFCVIGHSRIGDRVLISSRVSVLSGIHQHGIEKTEVPIGDQEGKYDVIRIEEDCWIGEGAIVGADVGKQSVIAAGSVILQNVEPSSIMMGNPARLVRYRK